jgi:hypothetical protein
VEKWSTTVLGILTLSVLAAAIWDVFKVMARIAWMRRAVVVAALRRAALPAPASQLRRVIAGLVTCLAVGLWANALPPAVRRT